MQGSQLKDDIHVLVQGGRSRSNGGGVQRDTFLWYLECKTGRRFHTLDHASITASHWQAHSYCMVRYMVRTQHPPAAWPCAAQCASAANADASPGATTHASALHATALASGGAQASTRACKATTGRW
jgi:hypothetical protein